MRGQEQLRGDLRHRQVGGEQGQQAQLGGGQRRRAWHALAALCGEIGPECLRVADQGAEAGAPLEQFVDLPHEGSGPGEVCEGEVDANELDPGLNGQMRLRVGEHRAQPLSVKEFLVYRCGIAAVQGDPGLHDADREGFAPGPPQDGARLVGQGLGPVPFAAPHRQQRLLGQRLREGLVRACLLPDAGRNLEGRLAAIEFTAKDTRDSLKGLGRWHRYVLRREPLHGRVGVGAHLLDAVPAQQRPEQGGIRLEVRVSGPCRVRALPPVNGIGPPFGIRRPPGQCGKDRCPHGSQRVSVDPALVFQPTHPPLQCGEPALPVSQHRQPFHQPRSRADVARGDGVFERRLGQVVPQAPVGRAVPQDRHQVRFAAVQVGQQHVAEQVMVAVPLSPPVQRHQQHVGPGQLRQDRGGAGRVQYRLAQRTGHPLQHRGAGQERPLPLRDPFQDLCLQIVADQPVIAAEGQRRLPGRAAFSDGKYREVQAGWPPFGPLVQPRHVRITERDTGVAQQRGCLREGERKVTGADLQNPRLGAQPGDPQGRPAPPGQYQPRPGRHVIGQDRHRGPALGIMQQVHIVQDEHHGCGHRRERRGQPRQDRAVHRAERGGQRVEYPPADRLRRVQCLGDVGEQNPWIVVGFVHRHPRECLAIPLGPLRQQRRFAIARRCHHRDDRRGVPVHQPLDQSGARDSPRAHRRAQQLRKGEVERRPVRNSRPGGPVEHIAVVHAVVVRLEKVCTYNRLRHLDRSSGMQGRVASCRPPGGAISPAGRPGQGLPPCAR